MSRMSSGIQTLDVDIDDWEMSIGLRVVRQHARGVTLWFTGRLEPKDPMPTFPVTQGGIRIGNLWYAVYGCLSSNNKPANLLFLTYALKTGARVKVSGTVGESALILPPDLFHLTHNRFSFLSLSNIEVTREEDMWHVAQEFERLKRNGIESFLFKSQDEDKLDYTPFLESQDIDLLGEGLQPE